MNLTNIIDILIDEVYNKKINNNTISDILKWYDISLDYDNSYILCNKIVNLNLFRIISVSSQTGPDLILNMSAEGYEFVTNYKSYSNFLHKQKLEQEIEQSKIKEKEQRELEAHNANIQASQATVDAAESAKTSKKWGIIGIVISSFLAFISLLFNAYQLRDSSVKDDSIKEINKILKRQDSLLLIQQTLQPRIDSFLNQKQVKK